jgi:hypothetical protein
VAAGQLVQLVGARRAHQLGHRGAVEGADGQGGLTGDRRAVGSAGGDQQEPVTSPPGEGQPGQRGRAGPVQVLDDDHHRRPPGQLLHGPQEGAEQPHLARRGVGDRAVNPDRRRPVADRGHGPGPAGRTGRRLDAEAEAEGAGQHRHVGRGERVEGARPGHPQLGGEGVGERLEGQVAPQLVAAPDAQRAGPAGRPGGQAVDPTPHQRALADPGLAHHGHQSTATAFDRPVGGVECGQLGVAAGERRRPCGHRRAGPGPGGSRHRAVRRRPVGRQPRRRWRGPVGQQQGGVEPLGLRIGRHAQVLDQAVAHLGVGGKRRRPAAEGGAGRHLQAQRRLVVGVVGQRGVGQHHRAGGVTGGRRRLGAHPSSHPQPRGHPQPGRLDPLALLAGEQRAAGQHQRRVHRGPGGGEAALGQRVAGLSGPSLELGHVEPVELEVVALVRASQPVGAQHPPEAGDEHPHLVGRPRRQPFAPEHVGQLVDRDGGTVGEGQTPEQEPRLAAAELALLEAVHREGTQQPGPQPAAHRSIMLVAGPG